MPELPELNRKQHKTEGTNSGQGRKERMAGPVRKMLLLAATVAVLSALFMVNHFIKSKNHNTLYATFRATICSNRWRESIKCA